MKTNHVLSIFVALAISSLCACVSTSKHALSALQGAWVGQEVAGPPGNCRMSISGDSLKFQGARPEEWYTARLTIHRETAPKQADILIEDCSFQKYAGKIAKGIYKLEDKTLTIAACEPGDESVPTGFERGVGSRARVFVFKKQ
jgi:uncharacterized protein (TIGR03067 family)